MADPRKPAVPLAPEQAADPAAGYYRAAGIEPWADFDGTLSHPDEPETRDATRKAAAMMKVSIPGNEKSHFPTMKDGAVRLLNLRFVVHNCSNAPLRNVRALLTGVALASAKPDPVIGHNVRLPCANLSDDVYAPTEIPIGGWEPFGLCQSLPTGEWRLFGERFPTTFDGRLELGETYTLTVLVPCDTCAAEVYIRARAEAGQWQSPVFEVLS